MKFVNHIMRDGRKYICMQFVARALDRIRTNLLANAKRIDGRPNPDEVDPIKYFHQAVSNLLPIMEPIQVGSGIKMSVPIKVRDQRRVSLAMKWLVTEARSIGANDENFDSKLAKVIQLAYKREGESYKCKLTMHKNAVACKASISIRLSKQAPKGFKSSRVRRGVDVYSLE